VGPAPPHRMDGDALHRAGYVLPLLLKHSTLLPLLLAG
jgi:hypothetical protein